MPRKFIAAILHAMPDRACEWLRAPVTTAADPGRTTAHGSVRRVNRRIRIITLKSAEKR
jgi:hypothetical protein